MPGHANFVGGPAARIRKLSSSSSHPNRRNTRLGGPSRISKPRRENVQFDFPWVPATSDVHSRRDEEEEEEGGGGLVEEEDQERERAREGEGSGAAGGGGGGKGKLKRKSVVLDLLDTNLTLGGFEAGKQALLDSDDWAGLNDSYISASDYLPSSPPASRPYHRTSSPYERDHQRSGDGKQKRVVSDDDEEWEESREVRGEEYMHEEEEDEALEYPDRQSFENPPGSPSYPHEHEHDPNQTLFDLDPHQPSPSPPRQQSTSQNQQQHHQLQEQNPNDEQHQQPPQSPHSSIATVTLSFRTSSNGVAHPHPRNYPVPSSSSDGDGNVPPIKSIGTSQFDGDLIMEEKDEELQLVGEGEEIESRNDASTEKKSPKTRTKKKKRRFSPDSQRITLGSSAIFTKPDRLLGSPPGPPRSTVSSDVASQQLKEDEQRWRASRERPSSTPVTSNYDNVELPNVMKELASILNLPDISGPASPLRGSHPPSDSGSEREKRKDESRGYRDAGEDEKKEEEVEYQKEVECQLNFDSRRWETYEEEDEEEYSWDDHRRDEEESSSQEKDSRKQQ